MKFPYRRIIFLICLFSAYQTFAAAPNVTLFMANWVRYNNNSPPQELPAITVTDVSGGGITQAAGISIILPPYMEVLWEKSVTTVKVNDTPVTPSYSKNLKIITIPVAKTFGAGEIAKITGQKIRIYDTGSSYQDLQLDVTGDGISDATGANGLQLDEASRETDVLPPYAITALTTVITGTTSVKLSWENPPDLDFSGIALTRTLNRAGTSTAITLALDKLKSLYSDIDILPGDDIQYSIKSKDDVGNLGEAVATSAKIPLENPPEVAATPEETQEEPMEEVPEAKTSILDVVTETQVSELLAKYQDISQDTVDLRAVVYLINKGALKGRKNKLNLDKKFTYLEFVNAAGKAFDISKEKSYWKTFQKSGYLKKTAKKKNLITKKLAVGMLLKIKGLNPQDQSLIEYSALKGKALKADMVHWIYLLIDL